MPDIVFDGKKVSVPPGTNLVEAGLEAGVPVPVFCYHKDLGAVGSCRVCAVSVTKDGRSRTVMACMTQAEDGTQVTTLDPASIGVRKYVLEWLMVNHPHDCPICDEGGECQLQDLTIAAGHGIRRYRGTKRTFANQFLGQFIQHEMNRCIACYRCSRFYQEVAGGRDFGVTGSRDQVYFGRFEEGPLESPFSGNLVELCPTGVFTDKLFRYKSRVWDLEIAPSVCPHCSVGCNVHPGARHRELQRVRVRENPAVNGVFLCDRGQFGHDFVMDPERPRAIRIRGESTDWEAALGIAGGGLLAIARAHGPESIAFVGSPRLSLEGHVSMAALAAGPLAGVRVSHFDDPDREPRAIAALRALSSAGALPLEQSDISDCDVLLVIGTSLVDEAPLAALAARQLARRGGRLFVLNSGEHYLNDIAERIIPVHPARLGYALELIGRAVGVTKEPPDTDPAAILGAALRSAERPGLLLGTDLLDGPAIAQGAELARTVERAGRRPRLGYVFPGPNGFGAAASARTATLAGTLADLESGKLRAAVLVESDLEGWGERARQALSRLELLVVIDYLAGPLQQAAHAFLPTTSTYESDGVYVNRAGRAQGFTRARTPGLSVEELIEHETFPRTPRLSPPAGDARPAWWVLEMLRDRSIGTPEAQSRSDLLGALSRSQEFWQPVRHATAGGPGAPLDPALLRVESPKLAGFGRPEAGIALYRSDRTLGSELLSRRSQAMQKMAGPPVALVSPADAEQLGVNGRVMIEVAGESVTLDARVSPTVPKGVLIVPRDVEWRARIEQSAVARVAAATTEEVAR